MLEVELEPHPTHLGFKVIKGSVPKEISLKNVSWGSSLEILKELAALGSFIYQGKRLVVDLFSKVPLKLEVVQESSALILKGSLLSRETIPLEKCQMLAPSLPPWFIHNQVLKIIATDLSGAFLNTLPKVVTATEIEELKEEHPIEVHVTKLQQDPKPILFLIDRNGAFANLKMDYGNGKLYSYPAEIEKISRERNLQAEAYWERDLLETSYIKKQEKNSRYFSPLNQVGKSLAFLLELGWTIIDAKQQQVLLETKRDFTLTEQGSKIQIQGKLHFEEYEADLKRIVGNFNRRDAFIDLGTGKTGLLNLDDSFSEIASEIEMVGDTGIISKAHVGLFENSSQTWQIPTNLKELLNKKKTSVTPSNRFQGELRPYQLAGLDWLYTLYQTSLNGILADDMGLGKTVQILAFFSLIEKDKPLLIVAPTSLLFNWQKEIARFLPSSVTLKYHGSTKEKALPSHGIVITSYHTLRADLELFKTIEWEAIILDEAQVVKNPTSQTAQSLYQLKSKFRIAMSGTIIENHARELWAHFQFLMPGFLDDLESFESQLLLGEVDRRYTRKIQKMIAPFILRRKKEEVAKDLPPLDEQTIFVEMTDSQRKIYENFLSSSKQGLLNKFNIEKNKADRLQIFEVLLRLRQIACHPLLVPQLLTEAASSGKWEALKLDIETILEEGKKALIFSQFATMLHLIAKELNQMNIPFCLLEGATDDRETQVERFQKDANVSFFLITLKAGGVGLNLTAADYVLIYDPWWHDAAEAQAIARAHRIGQTKPVIAKRYITSESVEEKLLTVKQAKTELFKNLTEENLTSSALTFEELLDLI